jgi:p-cumate 2,3-dioxygenase alpha subunit
MSQAYSEFLDIDAEEGRFQVAQAAFTDQSVFEQERDRIFRRCWLYIGYESEIPEPGDYLVRDVGGYNMIFNRDRHGVVHALHNVCTHRGTILAREPCGNAKTFTCPYHGWVYNNAGRLLDVNSKPGSHHPKFNADGKRNLMEAARLEHHRGFYFVNFNPRAVSLQSYLGAAADYIDIVADQTEQGFAVQRGESNLVNGGNWKLLPDNQVDMWHGSILHSSYFEFVGSRTGVANPVAVFEGISAGLGNGHCMIQNSLKVGRAVADWVPAFGEETRPIIEAVKARLVSRFGAERAGLIATTNRNMVIFPNLILNDNQALNIRTVYPLAPDRVVVHIWSIAPKEEHPLVRKVRLQNHLTFIGPGGFAHPDDYEIFDLMARGNAASPSKWHDYSKGFRAAPDLRVVRGDDQFDELQQRAWWSQWDRIMGGAETLEG